MNTQPERFMDYTTLPPFPARPTQVRRRPAWAIGLLVLAAVTGAGVLLGPVVLVLLYDLSPLYPLTLVFGVGVGALYGFAAGIFFGGVTALGVGVVRAAQGDGVTG